MQAHDFPSCGLFLLGFDLVSVGLFQLLASFGRVKPNWIVTIVLTSATIVVNCSIRASEALRLELGRYVTERMNDMCPITPGLWAGDWRYFAFFPIKSLETKTAKK